MRSDAVRKPAVSGIFYPETPSRLDSMVSTCMDEARPEPVKSHIFGLIVPHAGYEYSGATAGWAYKLIRGRPYRRVIVFAPSHKVDFRGASVFQGAGYETPLGLVRIDEDIVSALLHYKESFSFISHAHGGEHSLEVQLPFLQKALEKFMLIPVLIRDEDPETLEGIVGALAEVIPEKLRRETLIVASSDLYHGYSYQALQMSDGRLVEVLRAFDEELFRRESIRGDIAACGSAGILAAIRLTRCFGAKEIRPLHQTSSADVTGQREGWMVGYLSAAIL
ncbi:MAG TPA: AmmeMemoRadiSam system protein B [Candidatus Sumerlaeota bacterium]|nr:AmmeMemoRadiSam system protein B [Candidatus Sumerlaeota bacterium]